MPRRKSRRKSRSKRKRGGSGCSLEGGRKYRMRGGGIWQTLTGAAGKVKAGFNTMKNNTVDAASDVGTAGKQGMENVGNVGKDAAAAAAGNPTSGQIAAEQRAERAEAELRALKSGGAPQPMMGEEEEVVNKPMITTGSLGSEASMIAAKSKRRRSGRKSKRRRRRRTKRRR